MTYRFQRVASLSGLPVLQEPVLQVAATQIFLMLALAAMTVFSFLTAQA
jgi:hypothetical protein